MTTSCTASSAGARCAKRLGRSRCGQVIVCGVAGAHAGVQAFCEPLGGNGSSGCQRALRLPLRWHQGTCCCSDTSAPLLRTLSLGPSGPAAHRSQPAAAPRVLLPAVAPAHWRISQRPLNRILSSCLPGWAAVSVPAAGATQPGLAAGAGHRRTRGAAHGPLQVQGSLARGRQRRAALAAGRTASAGQRWLGGP
jgi:hypothetical protein